MANKPDQRGIDWNEYRRLVEENERLREACGLIAQHFPIFGAGVVIVSEENCRLIWDLMGGKIHPPSFWRRLRAAQEDWRKKQ